MDWLTISLAAWCFFTGVGVAARLYQIWRGW